MEKGPEIPSLENQAKIEKENLLKKFNVLKSEKEEVGETIKEATERIEEIKKELYEEVKEKYGYSFIVFAREPYVYSHPNLSTALEETAYKKSLDDIIKKQGSELEGVIIDNVEGGFTSPDGLKDELIQKGLNPDKIKIEALWDDRDKNTGELLKGPYPRKELLSNDFSAGKPGIIKIVGDIDMQIKPTSSEDIFIIEASIGGRSEIKIKTPLGDFEIEEE